MNAAGSKHLASKQMAVAEKRNFPQAIQFHLFLMNWLKIPQLIKYYSEKKKTSEMPHATKKYHSGFWTIENASRNTYHITNKQRKNLMRMTF